MQKLKLFLIQEKQNYTIYPKGSDIFNAFNQTPFDNVKVVILGQDPYHGQNQAHGLSFSVQNGMPFPPSLQNIYKELVSDVGCSFPSTGDLTPWASQGVLLLNTVLTVRAGEAFSHRDKGWETFTDKIIKILNDQKEHVVFILWGAPAAKKQVLINTNKHRIVTSVHPSPLSAYRGFFGSKPFSITNEYLKGWGMSPIDWCAISKNSSER